MSGALAVLAFMAVIWALLIAGGGVAVAVLGPLSISGFGELDGAVTSAAKGAAAVAMSVGWVIVLGRIKGWMFARQMR